MNNPITKLLASYFAGAFGLLQIVDIAIDRLSLPVEILNYLLILTVVGFVGILTYSVFPSLIKANKPNVKQKKSIISIVVIVMIFTLSVSNIFLFRESSLSDVRNEAYSSGFALIDNLIENERYIEASRERINSSKRFIGIKKIKPIIN